MPPSKLDREIERSLRPRRTKLTGIAPQQITDVFGSDAFRYYFLRAITFGQDGSFSWEDLAARYQAELANGFGNLASRVIAMIARYRGSAIPEAEVDVEIAELAARVSADADDAIGRVAIHEAIAHVWRLVDALNLYITEQEPWVLAKDEARSARLDQVLATAAHGLGTLAVLLSPVMPKATAKLWTALGGEGAVQDVRLQHATEWKAQTTGSVQALEALFPRIEEQEAGAA
jgi:methionyl-tRNA synthetase